MFRTKASFFFRCYRNCEGFHTDEAQYHASGRPFRLFWVDAGKYDIALQNSHATVAILKRQESTLRSVRAAVFTPGTTGELTEPVRATALSSVLNTMKLPHAGDPRGLEAIPDGKATAIDGAAPKRIAVKVALIASHLCEGRGYARLL